MDSAKEGRPLRVKELRAVLSILQDDSEIFIEWQEGTRRQAGRVTVLNSVEIEEDLNIVTLKAFMPKESSGKESQDID